MAYLDILKMTGPSAQEIRAKEAAREKKIKEGAKEEIADNQARIAELKANPGSTYRQVPEMREDWEELREAKEAFQCSVQGVAESFMVNAEDESEAVKNYTQLVFRLQQLQKHCARVLKTLDECNQSVGGPEQGKSIDMKEDYFKKIMEWIPGAISKTQEKIQDELNHNSSLIAEYIEFTGITPAPDGIKEIAKTISK